MINIINSVFIKPLRLMFELIFSLSYKITDNVPLSIVALSFVLNILLLPLYKKAEEIQEEENNIQKQMKPDIDFIKKTFSGNEQFMVLQTYYRQHNYKPIYALKSSISLLLQIPFFLAAYSFLSNLKVLEGASIGTIVSDLSKPDGILFGLNLFPILMTLINVVSTYIYTRGKKFQPQLYIMALLFLILLYKAPAALSLYYLLNNIFSLIKNILSKAKNKEKIISIAAICVCLIMLLIVKPERLHTKGKVLVYGTLLITIVLSYFYGFTKHTSSIKLDSIKPNKTIFLLCTIYLFVLTGILIPASVIKASPEEFISQNTLINPLYYIFQSAQLSFGLFVLWFNVFDALLEGEVKKYLIL